MAETLNNSMGDFLARFIKRVSQDPAFSGQDSSAIEAEAMRRVKEEINKRTAAVHAEIARKRKEKAEEWAEKLKSDDEAKQAEARKEAKTNKYRDGVSVESANSQIEQVEKILDVKRPEWLKTEIHHSPEAAEFIARITQLPEDLQNDPSVLYTELGKFYVSVNWQSTTPAARREARYVMNRVLDRIESLSGDDRDFILERIDPTSPYYHLRTEAVVPAGEPPRNRTSPDRSGRTKIYVDKQSPEYKEWVEKKVIETQAQNLNAVVDAAQVALDLPQNRSPENQKKRLEDFLKNLSQKETRFFNIDDARYLDLPAEQAASYISRVQARINELEQIVITQGQEEHMRRQIESGQLIEWDQKLADKYPDNDRKVGELATFRVGRLSNEDVKLILYDGIVGQKKWLSKFRERYVGAAGEPFKENLEVSMQFEEFMQLVGWANGERHHFTTQHFRDHWALFQDMDQIIKSPIYRPAGQKADESFNVLRYFTTKHHEMLRKYDYLDMAKAHFTESLEDIMELENLEYNEALAFLKEQTSFNGENMRRVDKLLKFREQYAENAGQFGGLDEASFTEMKILEERLDRVGRGILLRDYHMTPNIEAYEDLYRAYDEYTTLIGDPKTSTGPEAKKRIIQLKSIMKHAWVDMTLNRHSEFNPDDPIAYKRLLAVRNLSPVEIRARDRMIATLRELKIKELGVNFNEAEFQDFVFENSWKIRDALWAANSISVGTGEAMEKGSKLGRGAMFDLQYDLKLPETVKVKHFMDRGFAERYQRVLNPYLFAEDFHMGGALGEVVRDLYYESAFQLHGYNFLKDKSVPADWKRRYQSAGKPGEVPKWVVYVQYLQQNLGISYSESLRPDLLATGLQTLSSYWRAERAILEPIQKEFERVKEFLDGKASAEYYGLGYQLASLPDGPKGTKARRQIMDRMMERKPSIFIKLLGNDIKEILSGSGIELGSKEWFEFQDSLGIIEMQLWRDPKLEFRAYNLTNRDQFLALAETAIKAVNPLLTAEQLQARKALYFNVVERVRTHMYSTSVNSEVRMDNWVRHKFKNVLVLTSSDFNWQKTSFSKLDMYATERRINDFQGQSKADQMWREILFNSEILSPLPGKETETILKVKEFHNQIVDYAGKDTAEQAATAAFETIINYNRNRAIYSVAGLIPGMVTLMKRGKMIGEDFEVAVENIPFKPLREGVKNFLEEHKLKGRKLNEWPRSVSDAVSLAVGFGGHESNAWDEFRIAGFLAGVETATIYTDFPMLLARMRSKFRTTSLWRLLWGVPRKYWWVVPVATVAVASMGALDEEKKKG